jgi:hypothetical protein
MGPITALTHTQCTICCEVNCQEPEETQPEEAELNPDQPPSQDEKFTLELKAKCEEFAQALAGKVMAQLKRGEGIQIQNKAGEAMIWQHVMTIRHHIPRILEFIGLPVQFETEEAMGLALHEQFAGCGIVDTKRIEVLTIERDPEAPALEGYILPATLDNMRN